MLSILIWVVGFLMPNPSPTVASVAKSTYSSSPITARAYFWPATHRLFVDVATPNQDVLVHVHFTQAYERGWYVGCVSGKLVLFQYDHRIPWDGIEKEIRR